MNRQHIFNRCAAVIGCVLLASCTTTTVIPPSTDTPTAKVSASAAHFWIPIKGGDQVWHWNIAEDNQQEYVWQVTVSLMNAMYDFGFTKFRFPRSRAQEGTLDQLLAAGQVNVWKRSSDGSGTLVSDMTGVRVYRKGKGLSIEVTESSFLAAFMKERPGTVEIKSSAADLGTYDYKVPVTYSP